jgi:hypothetical protein
MSMHKKLLGFRLAMAASFLAPSFFLSFFLSFFFFRRGCAFLSRLEV